MRRRRRGLIHGCSPAVADVECVEVEEKRRWRECLAADIPQPETKLERDN